MPTEKEPKIPKCEASIRVNRWPHWVDCHNEGYARILNGSNAGMILCEPHFREWEEEAEEDGFVILKEVNDA